MIFSNQIILWFCEFAAVALEIPDFSDWHSQPAEQSLRTVIWDGQSLFREHLVPGLAGIQEWFMCLHHSRILQKGQLSQFLWPCLSVMLFIKEFSIHLAVSIPAFPGTLIWKQKYLQQVYFLSMQWWETGFMREHCDSVREMPHKCFSSSRFTSQAKQ